MQRSDIIRLVKCCCFSPQNENPFQLLERAAEIRLIRSREENHLPEAKTVELCSKNEVIYVSMRAVTLCGNVSNVNFV